MALHTEFSDIMEIEVIRMLWLFVLIGGVLIFASLIDHNRKKIKNNGLDPINSHAKPGEDQNFTMGSHRYHDGGGSGGES